MWVIDPLWKAGTMQRFFEHRAVVSRLSVGARSYSTTQPKVPLIYRGGNDKYEKTLGNLKVGASTRVMYQGFTGSCVISWKPAVQLQFDQLKQVI